MNVISNIKELLYLHDCVILPGFGGFITNYVNAFVSEKNIFYPPKKIVAFNRNLKNDDGLLINHIVKISGIEYSNAKAKANEFVENINASLRNAREINFEGIGNFRFDKNSILQFEPLASSNFLKDSFGLSAFYFPGIKPIRKLRQSDHFFKDKESINSPLKNIPVRKILTGTFILVLLALIPGNSNIFNNLKINKVSFFPSETLSRAELINNAKSAKVNSMPRSIRDSSLEKKVFQRNVNVKNEKIKDADDQKTPDNNKFQLVAGCFKDFDNAVRYKQTLIEKGINATVQNYHHGLYKVTVGSFSSEKQAIHQISIFHSSSPDISVWLLKI